MPTRVNTNDRFQWNWTDPDTGYEYFLRMYPSDVFNTYDFPSGTQFDMDIRSLQEINWDAFEYEQLNYGMPKAGVMEITFDLQFLSQDKNGNTATAIINTLQSPIIDLQNGTEWGVVDAETFTTTNLGNVELTFDTGNVWELLIDFKDDDTSSLTRSVYTGIQRSGLEQGINFDGSYTITLFHVAAVAAQALTFETLHTYIENIDSTYTPFISEAIIDAIVHDAANNNVCVIGNAVKDADNAGFNRKYHLYKRDEIQETIDQFIEQIFNKLLRLAPATSNSGKFNIPVNIDYYRQTYVTGTIGRGALLSDSDIYRILLSFDDDANLEASLFSIMAEDFDNYWIYAQDYINSQLLRGYWLTDTVAFGDILQANGKIGGLDANRLFEFDEIKLSEERPNISDSSLYEFLDNDLSQVKLTLKTSRTETNITTTIVENNYMPVMEYAFKRFDVGDDGVQNMFKVKNAPEQDANLVCYTLLQNNLHWYNYYYKTTPTTTGDLTTQDMPIRVHNHCIIALGDSQDSDDYVTETNGSIVFGTDYTLDPPFYNNKFGVDTQQLSSLPYIAAKTVIELYKSLAMSEIIGTTKLNVGTAFSAIEPNGCDWITPKNYYDIPLSPMAMKNASNVFQNINNNFHVKKSSITIRFDANGESQGNIVNFEAIGL